ncbi:hypothetical protein H4W80_000347 [Nonomuraea angiospora]|uniref:Uncharacterized protein n=1 Tax=Nonomuraea angiospora TaxID=46172 RepID=A0ABR9LN56_9ACTN|nr:hypothetical protein [Nonomuraea angiospora]
MIDTPLDVVDPEVHVEVLAGKHPLYGEAR